MTRNSWCLRKEGWYEKDIFSDSDEVKWAQKAIEKLKLKGLLRGADDGKYYPTRAVTKIEAVVMALRIMDWEDEALSVKTLPKEYKGGEVQKWAIGYVTTAYKKGILDNVDMMYFKPNEPVKRHEVAKYVIRALGKEDEAEEYMDEDLPFVDAAAVPQGSVGYVYLINELGIMTGDGKRFNPMGTLTRAEMAVLFDNLDEKVDSDKDLNEYKGIVKEIDDDEILVNINGKNKSFDVSDDVVVYEDRKRIDYFDIQEGSKVVLQVEDGEVVYIEIIYKDKDADKIISKYTGELVKVGTATITVKIKDMTIIFEVIDDVEVYFKGVKGDFDELKAGDDVTVTVDNRNRARKIYVYREAEKEKKEKVKGVLTGIGLSGKYYISVDDEKYSLSKDAEVEIEDEDAELEDLAVGMKVEAEIEDGVVTYVYAQNRRFEVEGEIKDIIYGVNNKLKLELEVDDEDYIYEVDEDAEITIEGIRNADLDDLERGMEGEFEIVNSTIVKIEIED